MKILIVSYFFPPYNSIGGVRIGKMAKYLRGFGHDVRVLTADRPLLQKSLAVEIPMEEISATKWVDVNAPAAALLGGRKAVARAGYQVRGRMGGAARKIGDLYKSLTNVPDGQVGWIPFAVAAGNHLINRWKPDVIYASGMPWSSLVVARTLSRKRGIPWVAELRDLWADNPYSDAPRWRKTVDQWIEKRTLRSASALIGVTHRSTARLREKYGLPAHTVLNGYDPEDFKDYEYAPSVAGALRIVYTGMIYEGRRDPSNLFKALAQLDAKPSDVIVEFFGRYTGGVADLAAREGVSHLVKTHGAVSYGESLRLQSEADVLLLLLWNDPRDAGVCPGKVYEYIGARRPVLILGPATNAGAEILINSGVGLAAISPGEIGELLRRWIGLRRKGRVPPPNLHETRDLTRYRQAQLLAGILEGAAETKLLARSSASKGAQEAESSPAAQHDDPLRDH